MGGERSLQNDKRQLCEMATGEQRIEEVTDAVHYYYLRLLQMCTYITNHVSSKNSSRLFIMGNGIAKIFLDTIQSFSFVNED